MSREDEQDNNHSDHNNSNNNSTDINNNNNNIETTSSSLMNDNNNIKDKKDQVMKESGNYNGSNAENEKEEGEEEEEGEISESEPDIKSKTNNSNISHSKDNNNNNGMIKKKNGSRSSNGSGISSSSDENEVKHRYSERHQRKYPSSSSAEPQLVGNTYYVPVSRITSGGQRNHDSSDDFESSLREFEKMKEKKHYYRSSPRRSSLSKRSSSRRSRSRSSSWSDYSDYSDYSRSRSRSTSRSGAKKSSLNRRRSRKRSYSNSRSRSRNRSSDSSRSNSSDRSHSRQRYRYSNRRFSSSRRSTSRSRSRSYDSRSRSRSRNRSSSSSRSRSRSLSKSNKSSKSNGPMLKSPTNKRNRSPSPKQSTLNESSSTSTKKQNTATSSSSSSASSSAPIITHYSPPRPPPQVIKFNISNPNKVISPIIPLKQLGKAAIKDQPPPPPPPLSPPPPPPPPPPPLSPPPPPPPTIPVSSQPPPPPPPPITPPVPLPPLSTQPPMPYITTPSISTHSHMSPVKANQPPPPPPIIFQQKPPPSFIHQYGSNKMMIANLQDLRQTVSHHPLPTPQPIIPQPQQIKPQPNINHHQPKQNIPTPPQTSTTAQGSTTGANIIIPPPLNWKSHGKPVPLINTPSSSTHHVSNGSPNKLTPPKQPNQTTPNTKPTSSTTTSSSNTTNTSSTTATTTTTTTTTTTNNTENVNISKNPTYSNSEWVGKEIKYLSPVKEDLKMNLIINIDHILYHSTKTPDENQINDESLIKCTVDDGDTYYIKLRPYSIPFLKSLSPVYNLTLFSLSSKQYISKIIEEIDKGQSPSLFKNLLTRESFGETLPKQQPGKPFTLFTANNFSKIFNIDSQDSLVILDDRDDIWRQFRDHLVTFERYIYFKEDQVDGNNNNQNNNTSSTNVSVVTSPCAPPVINYPFSIQELTKQYAFPTLQPSIPYLEIFSRLLISLQNEYMSRVQEEQDQQQSKENKNTLSKITLKDLRSCILMDCNIVFSGIFPKQIDGTKLHQTRIVQLTESLGATVQLDITPTTTHLIFIKEGTSKVIQALKSGIKVVHFSWLRDSIYHWEKMDELNYNVESFIKSKK